MKELSLHVLDIVHNSLAAGASHIRILLSEDEVGILTLTIGDDGRGMNAGEAERAVDPFYTTRKTRRVGLGLPLLKMAAELTGGSLTLVSSSETDGGRNHGTSVTAVFDTKSVNMMPVGDMAATVCAVLQGYPEVECDFRHTGPGLNVSLDTTELRSVLGADIPLSSPDVLQWVTDYLSQQYQTQITA